MTIWLGTERSAYEYQEILKQMTAKYGAVSMRAPDDDSADNPVGYQVVGGVAIISIRGSTVSNTSFWTRELGVATYPDMKEQMARAADDKKVKFIVQHIDSPGGAAAGVKPYAKFVSQINEHVKPVISFTSGTMASAALWYGTAAGLTIADEDARIGSLGAILVHQEYVDQLKMDGVTATVFRTSPFKAMGNPYEKLDEVAKEEIMRELMDMHMGFVKGIATNRNLEVSYVAEKIATGRVYNVRDAMGLKLVDKEMNFDQLIAKLGKVPYNAQQKTLSLSGTPNTRGT